MLTMRDPGFATVKSVEGSVYACTNVILSLVNSAPDDGVVPVVDGSVVNVIEHHVLLSFLFFQWSAQYGDFVAIR